MNQSITQEILKDLSPFPFIINTNSNEIVLNDGLLFSYPRFCNKNIGRKRCKELYNSLPYFNELTHSSCPHGFSIFSAMCNNEKIAFSGLIAYPENNYCPKEFRRQYNSNKTESSRVIKWVVSLKESISRFESLVQEKTKAAIASLHDIQKTNSLIKQNAEDLINKQRGVNFDDKFEKSPEHLKSIFKASELLSTQMELISLFSNPGVITAGKKRPFEVFRFFDKMRLLYLSKADAKGCKIILKSPFSSAIHVHDSFALIPHILIDNAVKYSQRGENINVLFEENTNSIIMKIKSIGPLILPEEKDLIFEKFVKGKNSSAYSSEGSGIGLYMAKNIVEKHDGKIFVESTVVSNDKNSQIAETTFVIEMPKS